MNHLTYNVRNKDDALRFWIHVLGVKQIPSQVDREDVIWLQLPSGIVVHFVEIQEAPSTPPHHGAFEVDDIEEVAKVLQAKKINITDITTRKDGQRSFFISDSYGSRIEICTKSRFGLLV